MCCCTHVRLSNHLHDFTCSLVIYILVFNIKCPEVEYLWKKLVLDVKIISKQD